MPAEDDFFGSHSRVAEAIADVIRNADSVNIVGLLGSWGSGKSTVVRQVGKSLKPVSGPTKTHLFTYDAWLHQNDPPRRAFLEALIGDLTMHSLVKRAEWDPRLADLTGRSEETKTTTTRQLSTTGKWIFLSLALVPIGLGFLDFDLLEKVFGGPTNDWHINVFVLGLALTAAPFLVISGFYLWWRPWAEARGGSGLLTEIRSKQFWLEHDEAHKGESILALLTNQSIETAENKTRISPEPTAIEFRSVFRDILASLAQKQTRLVIVIDNLDRLAEADAMQLWGTIRSLFLGRDEQQASDTGMRPPAIILPIDESAIQRMFAADHVEDAGELAAAFIDKTFDVAFHVNDPVMSDWRNFLENKLVEAFGGDLSQEAVYWTTRFIEERFNRRGEREKITPRKLVKLVNAMAALLSQWGDTINFVTVAFYCLRRSEVSVDIVEFLQAEHDIGTVVDEWKKQLVALHFGVQPEKAFQVLLHEPLRSAITEFDKEEFNRLMQVEGAWPILEEIVARPPFGAKGGKPESRFVANAALLICPAAISGEIAAKRAMAKLSRIWIEADELGGLRSDLPDVIGCLATELTGDLTDGFLSESMRKLGVAVNGATLDGKAEAVCSKAIRSLSSIATNRGSRLPALQLGLSSEALFGFLGEMPSGQLRHIRTDKTAAEITSAIVNGFADQSVADAIPGAMRALTSDSTITLKDKGKIDWNAVANSAGEILQNQALAHHAFMTAVDTLGILHALNERAAELVKLLFDQGRLTAFLNEADRTGKTGLIGDIATLMLLHGSDFAAPNGKTWSAVLEEHKDILDRFDTNLSWYRPNERIMVALKARAKVPSFAPVIDALAKLEISKAGSKFITTSYALSSLTSLSSIVGDELLDKLIMDIQARNDFWDCLRKISSDAAYLFAVNRLAVVDGIDKKLLLAEIRERLQAANQAAWAEAVSGGTKLFDVAQSHAAEFARKPLEGDSLKRALLEASSDLLAADQAMRRRWFLLTNFVSRGSRTTMMKNIRDILLAGNEVTDLPDLLDAGGDDLLTMGKFTEEADKTARHIALPLLIDDAGHQVLLSKGSFFASICSECEPETKEALLEALEAAFPGEDRDTDGFERLKQVLGPE
ncbi:MAG: AAA family ATPase [Sphingomonadales bacterium]|nr:AAA family ATPase [Sphingomonadales bacterium]